MWTENGRRSHNVAARLDAGYGRDLSIYALDDFSRTKHVMHNHGRLPHP